MTEYFVVVAALLSVLAWCGVGVVALACVAVPMLALGMFALWLGRGEMEL